MELALSSFLIFGSRGKLIIEAQGKSGRLKEISTLSSGSKGA